MKTNKFPKHQYQYRVVVKTGELILVYVNYNISDYAKRWYECYNVNDNTYFETNKEYLLTNTIRMNPSSYIELTDALKKQGVIEKNVEIVNRLPSL